MSISVVQQKTNVAVGDLMAVTFDDSVTVGNVLVVVCVVSTNEPDIASIDVSPSPNAVEWDDNGIPTLWRNANMSATGPSGNLTIAAVVATSATADSIPFPTVDARATVHAQIFELSGCDPAWIIAGDDLYGASNANDVNAGTLTSIDIGITDPLVFGSKAIIAGWAMASGGVSNPGGVTPLDYTTTANDALRTAMTNAWGTLAFGFSADASAAVSMVFLAPAGTPPDNPGGCMLAMD